MNRQKLSLICLVIGFLLIGCRRSASTTTVTPVPVSGLAQVDSVEILLLESMPVRAQAVARGTLPDGCTLLDEASVTHEGDTFNVQLTTTRPAEAVCTQVLVPFERLIPLEIMGLPAGRYTVRVNAAIGTFELAVDNLDVTPTPVDDASASIRGVVYHDVCALAPATENQPEQVSEGCIPIPGGGYEADGLREADEPGLGGVRVDLGQGTCPSEGLANAATLSDGNYSFTGLSAGRYCVSVDAQDPQNLPLLVPGGWTAPAGDEGVIEVDLEIGEQLANVNFGWDHQFLPLLNAEGCIDQAAFVADITVPDDARIAPGAQFTKTWRLRNAGTCTWGPGYFLVFVLGERMGGSPVQLPVVPPGAEVDLSIELTAPEEEATYRGDWQLQNADRVFFGFGTEFEKTVFLRVVVDDNAPTGSIIRGLVWSDRCVMLDEDTPSEGCVADGAGGFRGNARLEPGEARIAEVRVDLYSSDCPAAGEPLETVLTDSDGAYSFDGLQAGAFCVQIDPEAEENAEVLGPGQWTYPEVDGGSSTVSVREDETRLFVAFGWDYQLDR